MHFHFDECSKRNPALFVLMIISQNWPVVHLGNCARERKKKKLKGKRRERFILCSYSIPDGVGACPQGAGSVARPCHRVGQGQRLQWGIYNRWWKGGWWLHSFCLTFCFLFRQCATVYEWMNKHVFWIFVICCMNISWKAGSECILFFFSFFFKVNVFLFVCRWISGQSLAMKCSKRWVTVQNCIFCK